MRMLIEFEKTERIRHLGLLDMQRTWQRILRRSHLPISYSKGFNPHINMSFASALSSGIPGDAELLEVSLEAPVTEEEAISALKSVLPDALPLKRLRLMEEPCKKIGALLVAASYRYTIYSPDGQKLAGAIPAYLAQSEIMALRKSKSAERMVDIRPMIFSLEASATSSGENKDDAGTVIEATVSFTEAATLKPQLLLQSLSDFTGCPQPQAMIRRTGLWGKTGETLCPLFEMENGH